MVVPIPPKTPGYVFSKPIISSRGGLKAAAPVSHAAARPDSGIDRFGCGRALPLSPLLQKIPDQLTGRHRSHIRVYSCPFVLPSAAALGMSAARHPAKQEL